MNFFFKGILTNKREFFQKRSISKKKIPFISLITVYIWYIDSEFLLFKFMCHRGDFKENVLNKCVIFKREKIVLNILFINMKN